MSSELSVTWLRMLLVVGNNHMVVYIDLPAVKVLKQAAELPVEAPLLLVIVIVLLVVAINMLLPTCT